jgi:actin-like ATPase involved in cell morphogenesis
MYALGIDLGTTFTAAATWRAGRAEIVPLGSRSAAVPSVVLLRDDETFLTGEAANRRGLTEPHRVAREFKRRMGDTTPILLGGVPQSAEALTARLLRSVVDQVISREGGPPSAICVCHPANWGPYKADLMRQSVRMADPPGTVGYTTEPEAAAVSYAQQQRIEPGAIVAVYDLGGGTFDAAVLRKTGSGFDILGQPEGIDRLGGIDFDAAVFDHVRKALGGKLAELDEDDPAAVAAVARLREECVQAKEALSADTDTTIPVLLPNVVTEVRLTRSELEAMVRPVLYGSVEALQRAVRSAGCTPEQLHSVLLVGGSSRMPIVAQLVSAEFGRPVAVDAHPKHAVALGAAWLASGALDEPAGTAPAAAAVPPPDTAPAAVPPGGSADATAAVPPPGTAPVAVPPPGTAPVAVPPAGTAPVAAPPAGVAEVAPVSPALPRATVTGVARVPGTPVGETTDAIVPPVPPAGERPARRRMLVGAGLVLAAVLVASGVAYAQYGRDGDEDPAGGAAPVASTGPVATPSPAVPADEQCTDEIKANRRWACLTSAVIADGKLTLQYDVEYAGSQPDVNKGYHVHFYGSDGTNPPDHVMGSHVPKSQRGAYFYDDRRPSVLSIKDDRFTSAIGDAEKVCVRIAIAGHGLVPDNNSTYHTGNCRPIIRR